METRDGPSPASQKRSQRDQDDTPLAARHNKPPPHPAAGCTCCSSNVEVSPRPTRAVACASHAAAAERVAFLSSSLRSSLISRRTRQRTVPRGRCASNRRPRGVLTAVTPWLARSTNRKGRRRWQARAAKVGSPLGDGLRRWLSAAGRVKSILERLSAGFTFSCRRRPRPRHQARRRTPRKNHQTKDSSARPVSSGALSQMP